MRHGILGISLFTFCIASVAQQREIESDWPGAAAEWFYNQRAYPSGQIPLGARVKALTEIQRIDSAARAGKQTRAATSATTWTSIGPKPTDPGATLTTSGRVSAIAIDPRDSNTIYLGAASGGVWKSTDAGANWKPLTDDQPSLAIGSSAR